MGGRLKGRQFYLELPPTTAENDAVQLETSQKDKKKLIDPKIQGL